VNVVVLHMRGGSAVTYSPPSEEVAGFAAVIRDRGFSGSLAIKDGPAGQQRIVNLAAVDWIEVKGAVDAASTS
jgi:hypothetical protein